ncbi:MAG: cell division protein ZapA [Burkholderiaceae bacterium]
MEHLTVQILGRDYRLSCEPAERETLLAAVAHVDTSMQTIRDQGKVVGTERIAVFAALNIAGELLSQASPAATLVMSDESASKASVADLEILRRMHDINALLDTALANQDRLF